MTEQGEVISYRYGSGAIAKRHLEQIVNAVLKGLISKSNISKKDEINLLSKMSDYIDVIVPRGGKGLVGKVQKFSNVHVIGHLEGLCHIFVDKTANLNMARKIIINAKMRRTSICGAVETLLIDEKAINSHAKEIINSLVNSGCEVRVDSKINKLFNGKLRLAKEKDWRTEYLDSIISIKTVKNVKELSLIHISEPTRPY